MFSHLVMYSLRTRRTRKRSTLFLTFK